MIYKSFEKEIPEGYKARIDGNKVVFEPKENEDERIERDILKTLRYGLASEESALMPGAKTTLKEAIVYLEKQKEQKPESCDCSRDEESYINGIHHVLMNPEAYGLIKQQPAEQLGGTFTSYDMAKTFTEGQNYVIAHPEKFGLCKPAEWSKEDEDYLMDVKSAINHYFDEGYAEELCDWFKSLRPQPKQEWSEEDKKMLETIDKTLFKASVNAGLGTIRCPYDDARDWLKSLRPQPHWKPSNAQMKALEDAFRKDGGNEYRKVINSLYCDLQKLL